MRDPIFVVGEFLHKHFEDFTKPLVLALAFFGTLFAIIGHYGTVGFHWTWFLFLELPLYIFCIWALSAAHKIYKMSKKLNQ